MEHWQLHRVRLALFPSHALILTFSALFPNSTAVSLSRPAITQAPIGKCSSNCTYSVAHLTSFTWSQMSITETYTAESVVLILNKRNNNTRTTTISNTEIDFGKIVTPTNLNSYGTVTTSVIDNDGSTRIV